MNNADMPAMPAIAANNEEFLSAHDYDPANSGLTKREHFAGLAMQAIIIGNNADICTIGSKGASLDAINCANALLAALEADND